MSDINVKICGITSQIHVQVAVDEGADYLGFILFEKSPRHVYAAKAGALIQHTRKAKSVAVMVDPDEALLNDVAEFMKPDIIQLHGDETPERCEEVRKYSRDGIWKALGVSTAADLENAKRYVEVVDRFVFDAKPPENAERPGGLGTGWDYSLLKGFDPGKPWLLAGGLTPDTVADAITQSGASGVDVVSGVESLPGVKDVEKIRAFIRAARGKS